MIKSERQFICVILVVAVLFSYLFSHAKPSDAELRCEYLSCAVENFLSELSDERMQFCVALAKQTENSVFKGHFDQVMFWVNHNTPTEVIAACPAKKAMIEELIQAQAKFTIEELAQIERNHIQMRPQILAGLKERQLEHEKGIKPAGPSAAPSAGPIAIPGAQPDLSTELKQGQAGLQDYLRKSMDISHPMPFVPEHEKSLMCKMSLCGYAETEGLMALDSEDRSQCNYLGALLIKKSFKGELLLFSTWLQKNSSAREIKKSCPTESQIIEHHEKLKAKQLEKEMA